jgi:hypothetical protein
MKASKESRGGDLTGKLYGKLLEESLVLLSTNPATADTLRPFKYVDSFKIVKWSLLVAQRKQMISWLISTIASACSRLEQTLDDKLKRSSHNVLK